MATLTRSSEHVLDNAVWHALRGPQARFALGTGSARRYDPEVSVFCALDNTAAGWRDLAGLAGDDGIVVVSRVAPIAPAVGWERIQGGVGHQMVSTGEPLGVPVLPSTDPTTGEPVTMRVLGADDAEAMIALVALAQPGPFRPRTYELGGYVGIFHADRLVAMAGQRMRPPGYCEISAVCTHPDARRRGYASIVTAAVARGAAARGETPFLHVAQTNSSARAVYEKMGFVERAMVEFAVLRAPR